MRILLRFFLLALLAVHTARAYDIHKLDDTDYYVVWPTEIPTGTISMKVLLPTANFTFPGTETTRNCTSVVQDAMATWNTKLATIQFAWTSTSSSIQSTPVGGNAVIYGTNNHINEIVMDSSVDGDAFQSGTLAVTIYYYQANTRVEADLIFNAGYIWTSYSGNVQSTEDMERVALHELGHVLGLKHPDQAGQTVTAIMNSHVSSVDDLAADDIAGAQLIYGAPGVVPANNNFANAATLTLSGNSAQATGTNVNASREAGEPNHAGEIGGRSVWWKWTAPGNGATVISTLGSNFDTLLGVYAGASVGSLATVASNDDEEPFPQFNSPTRKRTSKLTFDAVNGTTYYIAVEGWEGEQCPITLGLTFTQGGEPPAAPVFTTQPVSQVVTAGANVVFTSAASGSPAPTYQWRKNSVDIPGANSTSLSLLNVQAANAGSYSVVASNTAGSATSNAVTLTVNPAIIPIVIQSQPVNRTAVEGSTVSFSVTASSATALSYVWKKNNANIGFDPRISGASTATLTLTGILPTDAGNYTVELSNGTSLATSAVAILTVMRNIGADFNGDGAADLFWQNVLTGERLVWLMNGTSPVTGVSMGTLSPNWSVAATDDFNSDGKSDLVWQNRVTGERLIWLMNGATPFNAISLGVVNTTWLIAGSGDMNYDGHPDLLWQNMQTNERTVWLMNGGQPVSTASLGVVPFHMLLGGTGNFGNNGQADIVWENTLTGQVTVWIMQDLAISSNLTLGSVSPQLQIAGVGDYNGDHQPDILFTHRITGERTVWLMQGINHVGTVTLATVGQEWVLGHQIPRRAPVDFNADGKSDLIWQNPGTGEHVLWLMDGTNPLTSVNLPAPVPSSDVGASGDFNGDGQSDLVWQVPGAASRLTVLMNGTTPGGVTAELGSPPASWKIVASGDFNRDGQSDVLWTNTATGEHRVWLLNGSQPTGETSLGTVALAEQIVGSGDFNADGSSDILWQNTSTGERHVWMMDGTTMSSNVSIVTLPTVWSIGGVGDFNNDGNPDIIWQNTATGERLVWLMVGTAPINSGVIGTIPPAWTIKN